jgi:BREX system ATP-binding protein BrxC/D
VGTLAFSPEQRVTSKKFGPGVVLRVFGTRITVRFDRYALPLQVEASSLEARSPQRAAPAGGEPKAGSRVQAKTNQAGSDDVAVRRAVDALRFGVVPEPCVADLTLRFSDEARWVKSRLPGAYDDSPTMTEICGAFGSGKSHVMAVVRHVSRSLGYVTASVEVDGSYVTFANPERLLAQLLRTMTCERGESATQLVDLCLEALAAARSTWPERMRPFPALYNNLGVLEVLKNAGLLDEYLEDLLGLLLGDGAKTPGQLGQDLRHALGQVGKELQYTPHNLVPRLVAERAAAFGDALMGYATVARMAGYRGLVVTFDEFEVEPAFLSRTEWGRLVAVVLELARRLQSPTGTGPLGVFVATVEGSQGLGDQVVQRLREHVGGERRELAAPTRADLEQLAVLVSRLYEKAYKLDRGSALAEGRIVALPDAAAAGAYGGSMRAHVRRLVSALDRRFGPPGP